MACLIHLQIPARGEQSGPPHFASPTVFFFFLAVFETFPSYGVWLGGDWIPLLQHRLAVSDWHAFLLTHDNTNDNTNAMD